MIKVSCVAIINHEKYIRPVIFFLSILLLISGCARKETPKKVSLYNRTNEASAGTDHSRQNVLTFGFDLQLGPKEEVKIFTPFLKYLEDATGKRFRIKFSERDEDTVKDLGTGVTHFAALGTLNYVIGQNKYGIKYLVSGVNRDGDPKYRSAIFTKPDSGIQSINDLKGKCFAFGSHMSTQGHLIPRNMLEDAGVKLEDLDHIYTGSHMNTVRSVLNGECDAGGVQDSLASRLASEGKIRIIKMSGPFPGSVIAYNSSLDSDTVNAVKAALLAFEPAGKHKAMLVDWEKTEMPLGFTEISETELNKVAGFARQYGLLTE